MVTARALKEVNGKQPHLFSRLDLRQEIKMENAPDEKSK